MKNYRDNELHYAIAEAKATESDFVLIKAGPSKHLNIPIPVVRLMAQSLADITHQAIRTRYIPPTNTRGSHYSASCGAGRIIVDAAYSLNPEENHRRAAGQLASQLGWGIVTIGGSFGGDYFWLTHQY